MGTIKNARLQTFSKKIYQKLYAEIILSSYQDLKYT